MPAPQFARSLLGWRRVAPRNALGWEAVPNNSDISSRESLQLGGAMLEALGPPPHDDWRPPANPGINLEEEVRADLENELAQLDPHKNWVVRRGALITHFSQYDHLEQLNRLVKQSPTLSVTIGQDYLIRPDVVVALEDVATPNGLPLLHAAVSCKWTIRSDRVQNIRHENLQMVRHRRGRQPHLVGVTAEPLPSRLAAIARGTGEVDAVYHVAYDELHAAVQASSNVEQQNAWAEITGQNRLLDYNRLADHLASW